MNTSSAGTKVGILRFYWRVIIRQHARSAGIIVLLMLASSVLEVLTIGLAVPLLDTVTKTEAGVESKVLESVRAALSTLGIPPSTNVVILFMLGIASVLFVCRSSFMLLHQYITSRTALDLRRETKCALIHRFLFATYDELARRGRGSILHVVEIPPNAVFNAISYLGTLFTAIFNTALLLILMLYLSWWATLLVGAIAILGIHGSRKVMDRRAENYGQLIHRIQGEHARLQIDAIDGIKAIKLHVVEPEMERRLGALLQNEMKPALRMALLRNLPGLINEIAASFIVLTLALITFLMPNTGMKFSALVAFLVAIRQCSPAVATINASFVQLNAIRRDVEVIDEVLQHTPTEVSGGHSVGRTEHLNFSGVSFHYASRPERPALQDINLNMKRGTVTAFVGHTGSGKTTIANLIVGLHTPTTGTISVNGVEIQNLQLDQWRRKIGLVSQDFFLFNGSISENIALWDAGVPDSDIRKAAEFAQLHEFVMSLPEAYDTIVGDRGVKLSGGQCQRIAIARAILKKPDILIFDEATSALDNLTERAVYKAIDVLRADAIVIVIAHRLSTIRDADQIVVLDAGRIVETGTHSGLIGKGGVYSQLYQMEPIEDSRSTANV